MLKWFCSAFLGCCCFRLSITCRTRPLSHAVELGDLVTDVALAKGTLEVSSLVAHVLQLSSQTTNFIKYLCIVQWHQWDIHVAFIHTEWEREITRPTHPREFYRNRRWNNWPEEPPLKFILLLLKKALSKTFVHRSSLQCLLYRK